MTSDPSRIVLVDDHPAITAGVSTYLKASFPQCDILCAETSNELDLILLRHPVDVVLIDMHFDTDASKRSPLGLELLRNIRRTSPRIPVIVYTGSTDNASVVIENGARGFILKSRPPSEIVDAIRTARKGDVYLDKVIEQTIVKDIQGQKVLNKLSPKEIQVFRYTQNGDTIEEIAAKIGKNTTYTLRARIASKFGLQNTRDFNQHFAAKYSLK